MGWVSGETFWFLCPDVADVFEGREAFEDCEPPPIVIGGDEVVQVGLILMRRCSIPCALHCMSNLWVRYVAVGPSASRGGNVNRMPVSVSTVWIL